MALKLTFVEAKQLSTAARRVPIAPHCIVLVQDRFLCVCPPAQEKQQSAQVVWQYDCFVPDTELINNEIRIQVWDWNTFDSSDFIGETIITRQHINSAQSQELFLSMPLNPTRSRRQISTSLPASEPTDMVLNLNIFKVMEASVDHNDSGLIEGALSVISSGGKLPQPRSYAMYLYKEIMGLSHFSRKEQLLDLCIKLSDDVDFKLSLAELDGFIELLARLLERDDYLLRASLDLLRSFPHNTGSVDVTRLEAIRARILESNISWFTTVLKSSPSQFDELSLLVLDVIYDCSRVDQNSKKLIYDSGVARLLLVRLGQSRERELVLRQVLQSLAMHETVKKRLLRLCTDAMSIYLNEGWRESMKTPDLSTPLPLLFGDDSNSTSPINSSPPTANTPLSSSAPSSSPSPSPGGTPSSAPSTPITSSHRVHWQTHSRKGPLQIVQTKRNTNVTAGIRNSQDPRVRPVPLKTKQLNSTPPEQVFKRGSLDLAEEEQKYEAHQQAQMRKEKTREEMLKQNTVDILAPTIPMALSAQDIESDILDSIEALDNQLLADTQQDAFSVPPPLADMDDFEFAPPTDSPPDVSHLPEDLLPHSAPYESNDFSASAKAHTRSESGGGIDDFVYSRTNNGDSNTRVPRTAHVINPRKLQSSPDLRNMVNRSTVSSIASQPNSNSIGANHTSSESLPPVIRSPQLRIPPPLIRGVTSSFSSPTSPLSNSAQARLTLAPDEDMSPFTIFNPVGIAHLINALEKERHSKTIEVLVDKGLGGQRVIALPNVQMSFWQAREPKLPTPSGANDFIVLSQLFSGLLPPETVPTLSEQQLSFYLPFLLKYSGKNARNVMLTLQNEINSRPRLSRQFFFLQRVTKFIQNSGLIAWRPDPLLFQTVKFFDSNLVFGSSRTKIREGQTWTNLDLRDPIGLISGSVVEMVVEKLYTSNAKPVRVKLVSADRLESRQIFKRGDDLRQDFCVQTLFYLFNRLWQHSNLVYKPFIYQYRIVPMGAKIGCIEFVRDSVPSGEYNWKLLSQASAKDKYDFICSMAGSYVGCWVLGIRDRHQDNMMIKDNRVFFHIDFGFILNEQPGFDAPIFSVPRGVKKNLSTVEWDFFLKVCSDAFGVLHQHSGLIIQACSSLLEDLPMFTQSHIRKYLVTSLMVVLSEAEAKHKIRQSVLSGAESTKKEMKYLMHDIAQKIK